MSQRSPSKPPTARCIPAKDSRSRPPEDSIDSPCSSVPSWLSLNFLSLRLLRSSALKFLFAARLRCGSSLPICCYLFVLSGLCDKASGFLVSSCEGFQAWLPNSDQCLSVLISG